MIKSIQQIAMCFVLVVLAGQVNGQYLQLKGGVNLADQIYKSSTENFSEDNYNRIGFHAGLITGIGFGPIGVEGGVLASTRGYNYKFSSTDDAGVTTDYNGYSDLYYIDVPVNLKLKAAAFYATIGPVFSYGLTGSYTDKVKIVGSDDVTETDGKVKWGNTAEDDLKRMDVGLGLGAGIQLGNISLSAGYNWGLVNLAPTTDNGEELKNRVLQFSLGLKILD